MFYGKKILCLPRFLAILPCFTPTNSSRIPQMPRKQSYVNEAQ